MKKYITAISLIFAIKIYGGTALNVHSTVPVVYGIEIEMTKEAVSKIAENQNYKINKFLERITFKDGVRSTVKNHDCWFMGKRFIDDHWVTIYFKNNRVTAMLVGYNKLKKEELDKSLEYFFEHHGKEHDENYKKNKDYSGKLKFIKGEAGIDLEWGKTSDINYNIEYVIYNKKNL